MVRLGVVARRDEGLLSSVLAVQRPRARLDSNGHAVAIPDGEPVVGGRERGGAAEDDELELAEEAAVPVIVGVSALGRELVQVETVSDTFEVGEGGTVVTELLGEGPAFRQIVPQIVG